LFIATNFFLELLRVTCRPMFLSRLDALPTNTQGQSTKEYDKNDRNAVAELQLNGQSNTGRPKAEVYFRPKPKVGRK